MSDLVRQLVTDVVDSVIKELLGKSHGETASKRKKRQARPAKSRSADTPSMAGRSARKTGKARAAKPARKQLSRRRTAASRSKQRDR
jgi:hypothetical protein